MLILTLILLFILVDFKTHVNISVSQDANLGAHFPLFITNTTANRNCDADINRNTSIYTSMDVSNTKAIQLYSQQNTTIIVNTILKSTNTNVKSTCQYNTKTFTNISKSLLLIRVRRAVFVFIWIQKRILRNFYSF